MVAPIVAAEAAKRAERAAKGLTGDIFVRRSTKVVGSGKNKHLVEDEFHLNPTTLAVGGAVTAIGALTALWVAQMRVSPQQISVDYGKWTWSDGSGASRELAFLKRGVAPTRVTGYITVWRLYVGGLIPYITVPEGTEGAVSATVPQIETASWTATETKTEYRFAIKERRGFTILGGATEFPDTMSEVAKPWWDVAKYGSPAGFLADKLLKR